MEHQESAFCRRLPSHLRRYPQMAGQDLYKLIFQAAMAAAGLLPFALDELRRFFAAMQAQGFPAVHHSERYRQAYRPAYRVIVRRFLTDHSARW